MFATAPLSPAQSVITPSSPARSGRVRVTHPLRYNTNDRWSAGSASHGRGFSLARSPSTPNATALFSSPCTDAARAPDLPAPHTSHAPVGVTADVSDTISSSTPMVTERAGPPPITSSAQPITASADSPRSAASVTRSQVGSVALSSGISHHAPAATAAVELTDQPPDATHTGGSSICFTMYIDPRASRPSVYFDPKLRALPSEDAVIRVGRNFSEPTSSLYDPVEFSPKVVSRLHCEFWCKNGQWFLKDTKSTAGTFLNGSRLSPPGVESEPFKVKHGDLIQLGADYRGGIREEFRCVQFSISTRVEPSAYNKLTHRRILHGIKKPAGTAIGDCTVCISSTKAGQALFVAPCGHMFHFKCIAKNLSSLSQCYNCRKTWNLNKDPEDCYDSMDEELGQGQPVDLSTPNPRPTTARADATSTPHRTCPAPPLSNILYEPPAPAPLGLGIESDDLAAGLSGLLDVDLRRMDPQHRGQDYLSDTGLHTPPADDFSPRTSASPFSNPQGSSVAAPDFNAASSVSPFLTAANMIPSIHADQYAIGSASPSSASQFPLTPCNYGSMYLFGGSSSSSAPAASGYVPIDNEKNKVSSRRANLSH